MSEIKKQIQDKIKESMKSGDKQALDAYRLLSSAITTVEKTDNKSLDDSQVISVLLKERKKREDSLAMYLNAGASAKADTERSEIVIIDQFLPRQASTEEIEAFVEDVVSTIEGGFQKSHTKYVMQSMTNLEVTLNIVIDKKIVSQCLNRL